ncbi:MAG: hypothetical protein A3A82_00680 [Candidatus Pacebacteria bacterium RIFCSPLOWO2_01_FULL_47_12]|nr:MAG: hypothetical protein A3A82_00680 [Candidatus Pacebacteria bacterium RIFCSPLOWO2_01_FULL_47_12]
MLIISKPITLAQLKLEAAKVFGEMVKAVVDVSLGIMAINGELHADEEALLLQNGSQQKDLWGINLYPDLFGDDDWLEFDSMINLRPSGGNNSRSVDDNKMQILIRKVVNNLVTKS